MLQHPSQVWSMIWITLCTALQPVMSSVQETCQIWTSMQLSVFPPTNRRNHIDQYSIIQHRTRHSGIMLWHPDELITWRNDCKGAHKSTVCAIAQRSKQHDCFWRGSLHKQLVWRWILRQNMYFRPMESVCKSSLANNFTFPLGIWLRIKRHNRLHEFV